MKTPVSIFWHRRDLRMHDNAGLYHALKGPHPVLPLFIFDRNILDDLRNKQDARVTFIHQALTNLQENLTAMGSTLLVRYGSPEEIWPALLQEFNVAAVYTNRDFEPYAIQRDTSVAKTLGEQNIPFHTYKDHVIFETGEVLKSDGTPYTIFTPYSRRWLEKLETRWMEIAKADEVPEKVSFYFASYPTEKYAHNLLKISPIPIPSLEEMGFRHNAILFPSASVTRGLIKNYDKTRNFPAVNGTSKLGIHFRFGTISIREKAQHAQQLNATYLNELIWRDFYSQILGHFPHVVGHAFRPQYDKMEWRNAPEDFEKWCKGQTGYPIVDAGMRELNTTGFMHNRVRMITASFLTKHLLIDWRQEKPILRKNCLILTWPAIQVAGSGRRVAAPTPRRISGFSTQRSKPKNLTQNLNTSNNGYPEFGTPQYPKPMVDHVFARERCLTTYKKALAE